MCITALFLRRNCQICKKGEDLSKRLHQVNKKTAGSRSSVIVELAVTNVDMSLPRKANISSVRLAVLCSKRTFASVRVRARNFVLSCSSCFRKMKFVLNVSALLPLILVFYHANCVLEHPGRHRATVKDLGNNLHLHFEFVKGWCNKLLIQVMAKTNLRSLPVYGRVKWLQTTQMRK